MTNDEFDKYLWHLYQAVNAAYMCQRVYWEFKNKETRRKYKDLFNKYNLFFRTSIHSHHVAVIMALCKVFENSTETRNFFQLLKLLKKTGLVSNEELASAKSKYEELKPIADRVGLLRNKFYAHLDKLYDSKLAYRDAKLQYNEFETLINGSLEIINILDYARCRGTYDFDNNPKDEVLEILEFLNGGNG